MLQHLFLLLAETEKRRKRCEAIAAAIHSLEERAKTATEPELSKIREAIEQGKALLEKQ